ncbi:MAG: hypothetical protein UH850_08360 [Paludibacteraceae bacterium]|nr:hypothetical protein [Paludibacteraceae bacterium]
METIIRTGNGWQASETVGYRSLIRCSARDSALAIGETKDIDYFY